MKKSLQAGAAQAAIIAVLVVMIIGALAWVAIQNIQGGSDKNETSSTSQQSKAPEQLLYLKVPQQKVQFELPQNITGVSYAYDESKTYFDGVFLDIGSLTADSVNYARDETAVKNGAQKLCDRFGIGVSKSDKVKDAKTGAEMSPLSELNGNYFYYVEVAKEDCDATSPLEAAINSFKEAVSKPEKITS